MSKQQWYTHSKFNRSIQVPIYQSIPQANENNEGQIIFHATDNKFYFSNGIQWIELSSNSIIYSSDIPNSNAKIAVIEVLQGNNNEQYVKLYNSNKSLPNSNVVGADDAMVLRNKVIRVSDNNTIQGLTFGHISGNINVQQMNGGINANSSTYWRGDGVWAQINTDVNNVIWQLINTNIDAQEKYGYLADTTNQNIYITFPTSATEGSSIFVKHFRGDNLIYTVNTLEQYCLNKNVEIKFVYLGGQWIAISNNANEVIVNKRNTSNAIIANVTTVDTDTSLGLRDIYPVIYNDRYIVCFGGINNFNNVSNQLLIYDLVFNRYLIRTFSINPPVARSGYGAVTYGNRLYIVGGRNGVNYFNNVDVFNLEDASMESLAPLLVDIAYPAISCDSDNGFIYVYGGWNGSVSNQLYRYNISTNQWSQVLYTGTIPGLYNAQMVYTNNVLYIYGGKDNSGGTSNFIRINLLTNEAELLSSNSIPGIRSDNFLLTTYGSDFLLLIGGETVGVYLYDIAQSTWIQINSSLNLDNRRETVPVFSNHYVYDFLGVSDGQELLQSYLNIQLNDVLQKVLYRHENNNVKIFYHTDINPDELSYTYYNSEFYGPKDLNNWLIYNNNNYFSRSLEKTFLKILLNNHSSFLLSGVSNTFDPNLNCHFITKIHLSGSPTSNPTLGIALFADPLNVNMPLLMYGVKYISSLQASIYIGTYSNAFSYDVNLVGINGVSISGIYFKIIINNGNYIFQYSHDGIGWISIGSYTYSQLYSFLDNNHITGIGIVTGSSGGYVVGYIDFIRYVLGSSTSEILDGDIMYV